MITKNIFLAASVAAASLLVFTSCGTNGVTPSASIENSTGKGFTDDTRYLARFTETEATAVAGGREMTTTYGNEGTHSAPSTFSEEFGDFTVGAEIKGFFPLSTRFKGFEDANTRIIKAFEKISDFIKIRDASGNPLYKRAVAVDEEGNTIREEVTGTAPPEGKDVYASVVLALGSRDARAIMRENIADENGLLKIKLTNHTDVKVKIIFEITAVRSGDMLTKSEFYPYKGGYLVYTGIKLLGASSTVNRQLSATSLPVAAQANANYLRKVLGIPIR